jgi:hypothetical protein
LVIFLLRRHPSLQFDHGGIEMSNKVLSCVIAGALSATLALASPAFARGGGGGGGGGHGGGGMGGGGHFGGMGGGGHFGGMAGGGHFGGVGGGGHFGGMAGGGHFGGVGGGMHFGGAHFGHPGVSPRFAFHGHGGFRHRVFDRHLHRFVFIGAPYAAYAAYGDCWRRAWTSYGWQWVNVCGNYDYGY